MPARRKKFGCAHARVHFDFFHFFKISIFTADSRKKKARARPEVDQLQKFFQILKILHLNYLGTKFYSLIRNRKKVKGGGQSRNSILYCLSFWICWEFMSRRKHHMVNLIIVFYFLKILDFCFFSVWMTIVSKKIYIFSKMFENSKRMGNMFLIFESQISETRKKNENFSPWDIFWGFMTAPSL